MLRHRLLILPFLLLIGFVLSMTSCEDTTFSSSVPRVRVYVHIDRRMGAFVTFTPEATYSYVTATREGYFLNGQMVIPSPDTDYFGYGGVVVYVTMMNEYKAFDMACPHCAARGTRQTCQVNSMSAVCPNCGEEYQLWSGTGIPTKGITREPLLQLPITVTQDKILVRQQ